MLKVLIKKDLIEKFSIFKKDKKNIDYFGIILSTILICGLITVSVWTFKRFIIIYSAIKINGITDIKARQFEILTIFYAVILFFGFISGIRAINFSIFENDDRKILLTLPIKSSTIFYSKLIGVYIKQVMVYFIILLPLNFTFAIVTKQSAYYVFITILSCFVFPILSLALASVFCLPVFYIKRFILSKYSMSLILTTVVTGLLFWCYSTVLSFVQSLIATGEMRFFFKEETMSVIISMTNNFYPANVFARMILKINIGANIAIIIATVAVATAVGYFIVNYLYNHANQLRTVSSARHPRRSQKIIKQHSQLKALVEKEFELVLRTPSYAFQYFSVAAIMPLMVYFCMGIGTNMLSSLTYTNNNFELAIFLALIFSTLTNTFCSTNISREGSNFYMLKTLPIKFEKIIAAKILFCTIIALVSSATTCIMLAVLHYVSWWTSAYIFFVTALLSEAQICFATRKDLNRPSFCTDDDCEVKESNNTISQIILIGLITATFFGGTSLYLSIIMEASGKNSSKATILFTGLSAIVIFIVALLYALIGLRKKFYSIMENS